MAYFGIHHKSFHVLPIAVINTPLDNIDHSGTEITARDINWQVLVFVRLSKDLSLSTASTCIVENTRVRIDWG